jgi:outer membrane protein assembly factor BamB
VLAAVVVAVLGLVAAGALARGSHALKVPLPLRIVAQMTLPSPSTRFDYADLDPATHRLFLAQLGASRLLEIDTTTRRVVRITTGIAEVHGVTVVPSLHRVFATATSTNQLVALDETSGAELYRAPTGDYPDGLTYVASTGQLWISNESGGTETVIDAATGHTAGTVELGGEAGNVRYDPARDRVLVDVQTRNLIAVIDPHTRTILTRAAVPGCDHDHGLILDPAGTRAFVACDGNAQLVVLSLPDLRPIGRFQVGGDPDVLAIDRLHHVLYVAAESGVLTTLDIHTTPGRVTGRALLGDNAHVVAVDATTGQAFFPVLNKHGQPTLLITVPNP